MVAMYLPNRRKLDPHVVLRCTLKMTPGSFGIVASSTVSTKVALTRRCR